MKKIKNLQHYKKLLPERLTVKIHKAEKGGFWAEIKDLPHCYTQAKNFPELIRMVNDAVFTYLEVPIKFRKKIGYYVPVRILKEIKRMQLDRFFNEIQKIADKGRSKERIEIFKIGQPV